MPKKTAGPQRTPAGRRGSRGTLVAVCLFLSIISAGTALALLGPKWRAPQGSAPSPNIAAAGAPAPVASQSQNNFAPTNPAKEYVYAGGRLVATEEPARLPQTITFAQPADKTYGDAPFALSATASSGLPVSFSVTSGPATVSGNTLTLTGAGTVSVKADQSGNASYSPAPGVSRTFTVAKRAASVTLSNLTQSYNGSPRSAAAATNPPNMAVAFTYNGSPSAPTDVGSYAVVATVTDANYQGSASGTLTIGRATATISLSNLAQTYDGSPKSAAATTSPAGLTGVSLTYNGSATPPTNAGSYAVAATLNNPNYTAAPASGTLVINKATAAVSLGGLTGQVYNGSARYATATTTPAGLPVNISYSQGGAPVAAPTDAGSYAVTATVNHPNYAGTAAGTLVIAKATATITLGGLTGRTYNGSPQAATATTSPAGLTGVMITYNGSPTAPTNAGSYTVTASLAHANYSAPTVSGTMVLARATPTITWGNPANIPHGTALGPTQLNATASTAGAFAYTPPAGTVLAIGNNHALSVSFAPADGANYNGASKTVYITVVGCPSNVSASFTSVSPIAPGTSSTLTWNVPHATGVTIDGVSGTFGASGSTSVSPAATTTYTLTATTANGCPAATYTRQVSVAVQPCPFATDTSFRVGDGTTDPPPAADTITIQPGGSALLIWSVPNATDISVTEVCPPGVPDTSCNAAIFSGSSTSGAISVSPTQTTSYTLWVVGPTGCAGFQKQVTVEVVGEECSPGAYFNMTPAGSCGGDVSLNWSVPNGASVTITDSRGGAYGTYGWTGSVGIEQLPGTTVYTLTAQMGGEASCTTFTLETTGGCGP